jgi:hypothetical protein
MRGKRKDKVRSQSTKITKNNHDHETMDQNCPKTMTNKAKVPLDLLKQIYCKATLIADLRNLLHKPQNQPKTT